MMNMEMRTRSIMDGADELLNAALKESGASLMDILGQADESALSLAAKSIKLYQQTKEYAIEQACFMDRMMEKMEFLEKANRKNVDIMEHMVDAMNRTTSIQAEILEKLEKKEQNEGETGA